MVSPVGPPWTARGGKPEDVRRHNLGTLLRSLHIEGPLSRAELTHRMGLNRSTIAGLVAQLTDLGLVHEERPGPARSGAAFPESARPGEGRPDPARPGEGRTGAGRPSLVVRTVPEGATVLAADIQVDRAVVGLVGLGGRVLARRHRRLAPSRSPAAVAAQVRRLVDAVLGDRSVRGDRVVGMGVSVPGVVRHGDGEIRFAPNLGWVDEPFGRILAEQLRGALGGRPVRLGNDADLGVLAEHLRGAARGEDDVVFIAGGVGVGGGCIVGGTPLVGAGGYAGELGHLPLVPHGRPCRCGARGCWETEIGTQAIARALDMPDTATDDLLPVIRAVAEQGSGRLDVVGRHLGTGLAGVVNLLNPRLVIIGGLLAEVMPACGGVVRATLDRAALAAPAQQVHLVTPALGADAVLVGASELAWTDLLADPVGVLCPADPLLPGTGPGRGGARTGRP